MFVPACFYFSISLQEFIAVLLQTHFSSNPGRIKWVVMETLITWNVEV